MEAVKDPDSRRREFIERVAAEYQAVLLRLCYIQLQDKVLAEDAVQETFLSRYGGRFSVLTCIDRKTKKGLK